MNDCPLKKLPAGHMPAFGWCPVCHKAVCGVICGEPFKEIDLPEMPSPTKVKLSVGEVRELTPPNINES